MSVDAILRDSHGGQGVRVGDEGELNVVAHPHPPKGEVEVALPVRERFKDTAGSPDMAVDGSTTSVEYSISADTDKDVYINYISLEISDSGSMALNKFGALSALTNGIEWCWESQDQGGIVLHDGIKTNLEFVRIGNDTAAVGDGTSAFLSDVSGGGTASSYLPSIHMAELFGMPYGIRLRRGTQDRIFFKVKDDLSTLVKFDAIAYGLKI